MARIIKRLTNTEVEKVKAKDKEYTLADGDGLFLLVLPSGTKSWRFNYYRPFTGKRTKCSLGSYPAVSLSQARTKREEYSALELGQGARPEGLLFAITTAGSNTISACKQHYDYCCQILDGTEKNESIFILIYELDDENEVDDPKNWIKANPNIGKSIPYKDFENTIAKARGIPSEWVEMLTKRFNVWCQGTTPWLSEGSWALCKRDYEESP